MGQLGDNQKKRALRLQTGMTLEPFLECYCLGTSSQVSLDRSLCTFTAKGPNENYCLSGITAKMPLNGEEVAECPDLPGRSAGIARFGGLCGSPCLVSATSIPQNLCGWKSKPHNFLSPWQPFHSSSYPHWTWHPRGQSLAGNEMTAWLSRQGLKSHRDIAGPQNMQPPGNH